MRLKNFFSTIGGVILLVIVMAAFSLGYWFWIKTTAEIKGVSEAERQIESASNRIVSYNQFFDLCAAIQEREASLIAQESILDSAESSSERQRVRANIAGITASRQGLIAKYNANANKEYTNARFLGESLPRKIDPKQENTVCEVN